MAVVLPGRDRKAGLPIELESGFGDTVPQVSAGRSGLDVKAANEGRLRSGMVTPCIPLRDGIQGGGESVRDIAR